MLLMGKLTINGHFQYFSIAMLVHQRVFIYFFGGGSPVKSPLTEPQVDVGRDFFLAADAVRLQRPAAQTWFGLEV